MSYTNETTHYSIPLPLGTDLTTPMDYNESMEALDTAVWGAVQDASTATSDAADAKETAQRASGDVATLSGTVTELGGTVTEQGTAITNLGNRVGDLQTDVYDMISSDSEPSATATHQHLVGDLFIYNDTLYVTTVQIEIGDTIVPNTNCNTTTIEEQIAGGSSLAGRVSDLEDAVGDTPLTTTAQTCTGAIEELKGEMLTESAAQTSTTGGVIYHTFGNLVAVYGSTGVITTPGVFATGLPAPTVRVEFEAFNAGHGTAIACFIDMDGSMTANATDMGATFSFVYVKASS